MNTNRTRTRSAAIIGTAALALTLAGVAGAQAVNAKHSTSTAKTVAAASTSGPEIHFWTDGNPKPGAEIDVYAECGTNKNGKVVTEAYVDGAASTVLTPLADAPYLGGTVTLPHNFVSPASLHLTCDNMATATTILATGQNESTADGLIPSLEGCEYEHAGMSEEPATSTEAPGDFWDGDGYLVPEDCEGDCQGVPAPTS